MDITDSNKDLFNATEFKDNQVTISRNLYNKTGNGEINFVLNRLDPDTGNIVIQKKINIPVYVTDITGQYSCKNCGYSQYKRNYVPLFFIIS